MNHSDFSSVAGSVTMLLKQLSQGSPDVLQDIFKIYFLRLAALGRRLLPNKFQRASDGEDLAAEVLAAFFDSAITGRLPELKSRHDVWRMLARRLQQRAGNELRRQTAQKENSGNVRGESVFHEQFGDPHAAGLSQISDHRLQALTEMHAELLERLKDPLLQQIARMLLEGYTIDDIAAQSGRSRATVYRKLDLIREYWNAG